MKEVVMMRKFQQIGDDFFVGPQPIAEDLREAQSMGVKTVVDQRMRSETAMPNANLVEQTGLDYVNIEVNKAELSSRHIDELEEVLSRHEGPYLVHCASGARATLLLMLRQARREGWTAERTFDEAKAWGYDLQSSPEFADFVRAMTAR
jgi:uncharacterized protein (TIGR01244 family)